MKVVTLFENRSISEEYKHRHGLSLYIETLKHKILFDTGRDEAFAENAIVLGVNLEEIDIVVISHGHYDHGGGLEAFLKHNSKAVIYMGKGAFDRHLALENGNKERYIGINKELSSSDRIVFVEGMLKIDNELTLFGNVESTKLMPIGNDELMKEYSDGVIKKDNFNHEINLLINEDHKFSLFCGCAHKGIINIIDSAKVITNSNLNAVVGGFHLMGMAVSDPSSKDYFDELSRGLLNNNTGVYYTCHCTGEEAYDYLGHKMSNLNELKTGMIIEV